MAVRLLLGLNFHHLLFVSNSQPLFVVVLVFLMVHMLKLVVRNWMNNRLLGQEEEDSVARSLNVMGARRLLAYCSRRACGVRAGYFVEQVLHADEKKEWL